MISVAPSIGSFKPNPAWASRPVFERTDWKLVGIGDVMENCAETCDPEESGLERFEAIEDLDTKAE